MGHNHTNEIKAEINSTLNQLNIEFLSPITRDVTELQNKVSNLDAITVPYSVFTKEDVAAAAGETPTKAEFDAVVDLINETKSLLAEIFVYLNAVGLMQPEPEP